MKIVKLYGFNKNNIKGLTNALNEINDPSLSQTHKFIYRYVDVQEPDHILRSAIISRTDSKGRIGIDVLFDHDIYFAQIKRDLTHDELVNLAKIMMPKIDHPFKFRDQLDKFKAVCQSLC